MRTALALVLLLLASGCLVVEDPFTGLPPGPWRAELKLDPAPVIPNPRGEPLPEKVNLQFEEVTEGILPFNFEVIYETEDSFHIVIQNGEERIRVDDITMGLDRSTAKDTLLIEFPVFDTYIRALFEEDVIEGEWVVPYRDNYSIPFVAYHGKDHRFTTLRKEPIMDVSGRWAVTFGVDTDDPYPAIGEFRQEGNHLTGTFLTETGDYRYLEGTVQDDKLYLSTFDGAHAYLFEAKINADSSLIGSYRSGIHHRSLWEARPDPDAGLADPGSMTRLSPGITTLDFAFPDPTGDMVALDDPAFRGKAKLVQIMGTWCPNCRDETEFLRQYLEDQPDLQDDLAVIALAFERYEDPDRARQVLRRYIDAMDIPYTVLHGGYYDKEAASRALPMLDRLIAYPTLLFLDRQNQVRKIHTGFSGPATSAYPAFREMFEQTVQELVRSDRSSS